MFSLIITIIAIALVAALALATIYYGGQAFNKSQAHADAAKVMTQSQQLLGAVDLFRADHGRWPTDMPELVAQNYLKSIPVAHLGDSSLVSQAHAAGEAAPWTMPVAGNPTFVLSRKVSTQVCRETNRRSLGTDGILKKAYETYVTQCYGSSGSELTVIASKDLPRLAEALPAGDVATTAPPAGPTGDDWYIAPGTPTSDDPDDDAGEPQTPATPVTVTVTPDPSTPTVTAPWTPTVITVTVTNTTPDPLTGVTTTAVGDDSTVTSNSCGTVLAAGASCVFTVTVEPSTPGPKTGTLTVDTATTDPVTRSWNLNSQCAAGTAWKEFGEWGDCVDATMRISAAATQSYCYEEDYTGPEWSGNSVYQRFGLIRFATTGNDWFWDVRESRSAHVISNAGGSNHGSYSYWHSPRQYDYSNAAWQGGLTGGSPATALIMRPSGDIQFQVYNNMSSGAALGTSEATAWTFTFIDNAGRYPNMTVRAYCDFSDPPLAGGSDYKYGRLHIFGLQNAIAE